MSQTVCIFSLSMGCTMNLMDWKLGWSLNNKYAVYSALLNGDISTVFIPVSEFARGYAPRHCVMPRSDSGQSRSTVSLTISRNFSEVARPSSISVSTLCHLLLNVELACLIKMVFDNSRSFGCTSCFASVTAEIQWLSMWGWTFFFMRSVG